MVRRRFYKSQSKQTRREVILLERSTMRTKGVRWRLPLRIAAHSFIEFRDFAAGQNEDESKR